MQSSVTPDSQCLAQTLPVSEGSDALNTSEASATINQTCYSICHIQCWVHHQQSESKAQHAQPDAAADEFKMFITLVFGVSIFGASTFAVSIGQMTDPADIWTPQEPPFTLQTVRSFLGAAWLCFTLSIALASFISSFIILMKSQAARGEPKDADPPKDWESTAIAASALLWTLLAAAFLFVALAMVPYAYVPGWCAVASTILFGLYVVWLICSQVRYVIRGRFYRAAALTQSRFHLKTHRPNDSESSELQAECGIRDL
ncbi:hypothetical protein G7054_g10992 [Neopestalotiopsis clavispora]|nr:hypothetical protein G7054_g10992 [Neopestalotiopsis clavispora]